ncbi:hypothetical protein [Nafulsella turpanensis]|uniref:hypothetical protein n=1 Tax=Nafulsella turpanensis TaxID=1265690 RepID=UPI000477F395|nr:hypothetical protein [Nafulsella turpanensis]
MRKTQTVGHVFRKTFLMVAMLAACVFSAGNGLHPLLTAGPQLAVELQEEQGEENERPVSYVSYASSALLPVATVSFLHQPNFKVVVPPLHVREVKPQILPPLRVDSYFRTLFRLIISPNAP